MATAMPSAVARRHDHWKLIVPKTPEPGGQKQAARIGKGRDPRPVRLERLGKRRPELSRTRIDHMNPIALHGHDRRQGPHLPQPLARAERQIEPGRVLTIDDVEWS